MDVGKLLSVGFTNSTLTSDFNLQINDTLLTKDILNTVQGVLVGKPVITEGWTWALAISFLIIIVIGTINNLVVLMAIFNHAKIRGLYHNLFIATLATSDLMISSVTLPITLWELINYEWPFAADSNGFCGFFLAAKKFPLILSATTLCGIAWDRYLSITYPYRGNITLGHAIIGIVIMIFSSVGVTYPVFHFSRINSIFSLQSQEQNIYVCHEMWPNWLRLSYQVMFSFGHILLPSIFIFCMYGMMLKQLKSRPPSSNQSENKRRHRVHRTLLAMALMYLATWLPFFIFTTYVEVELNGHNHLTITYGILRLIGALNTIVNPVLYGYLNSSFRKYYKKVYQKLPWYTTSVPPDMPLKVMVKAYNKGSIDVAVKCDFQIAVPNLNPTFNLNTVPMQRSNSLNCCPKKQISLNCHTKSNSLGSLTIN